MKRRANASSAVVFAVVSDLHCGSTVALCPPTIALDDGGEYRASKAQQWLWQGWGDFWARVARKRDEHDAALYAGLNGDLVDGDHHNTSQILSRNPNAQAAVVAEAMRVPLALGLDKLWVIRGTEAHVGGNASAEERYADGLRRDKRPVVPDDERGTASHWHARLDVQGVRFDLAHHGRVGQRPWTKPNVVANLAAEIFYNHARDGVPHPHVAIRSHMHQLVDTYDQHPTRVIQTPAWQLATAFIHRIAPGALADVGGVIFVVRDGKLIDVDKVLYRPEPTPLWRAA